MSRKDDAARRPVEDVLRSEKLRFLCQEEPVQVATGTTLRKVLSRLRGAGVGGAALVTRPRPGDQRAELIGIFTERDFLLKVVGRAVDLDAPVDDFMTTDPKTVSPEDTFDTVIRLMTEGGYRHLPVVGDDGGLVGLVSTRDIVLFLADFFPAAVYNLPPRSHKNLGISSREGG